MLGQLVGSYTIIAKLGEGGMGEVFLAEHPLIGQRAAIKMLRPEFSQNQEIVTRFFNEARAAAMARHPGIIGIYDFGYHASGCAFIVMEYLEGESLGTRLRRVGRIPERDVVRIARQVASALVAAHQKGITHRDLKPDNLFLVPDAEVAGGERAKVLDFGIAKLGADGGGSVRTRTGAVMGSPAYMSPEQCRGSAQIDERSDIYSLGCVVYEMLAGQTPFSGEGYGEVIGKHMYEAAPSLASLVAVSPDLDAFVRCAMAKDPAQRQQTMSVFLAALERMPTAVGTAPDHTPLSHHAPAALSVTTLSTAAAQLHPPTGSRRGVIAASAGIAVLVAAVAVFLAMRSEPGAAESPAPDDPALPVASAAAATPTSAPAPVPAPVPAPAAAPPVAPPVDAAVAVVAPIEVTLVIESSPSGAEVFRAADGVRVGKTPFETHLTPVSGELVYLVKKSDFRPKEVRLPADRDGKTSVTLDPVPKRPKKKPVAKPKDDLDPYAD